MTRKLGFVVFLIGILVCGLTLPSAHACGIAKKGRLGKYTTGKAAGIAHTSSAPNPAVSVT